MRIGVNALYLIPGGVGGTEIYLRSLLQALAKVNRRNEYFVFTNRETGEDLVPEGFTHVPCGVDAVFRPGRILYEQFVLPARAPKVDVLFNPGFTAPVAHPNNVTVFHDLQHKRHPEYFRWFDLPFWNLLLWAAVRRSQRLIAVSEATRDDLQKFYGAESTVVHHGADPAFFEIAEQRQPEDFFLCVSTLHPHKNIERLVRAFAIYGKSKLVLAGMKGFQTEAVERQIRELGLGGRVRVTGWIPRAELLDLYRRAKGFIYPSTFEGFGMPVIEALAAEVPLACSDIEPMRSLAAGDAVLFDPLHDAAVADAFARLETKQPVPNARIRREFTWERAAQRTLEVLNA